MDIDMDIEHRIIQILADQFDLEESTIQLNSKFEDLCFSTFDLVDAIVAVEEEYNLIIPDDSVEKIKTVKELVAYFKGHYHETE